MTVSHDKQPAVGVDNGVIRRLDPQKLHFFYAGATLRLTLEQECSFPKVSVARAFREALSLHLDDVVAWYHRVSVALSDEVEAAFASGDQARIDTARAALDARSAVEMQILGALDLVGRG